jgi:predicted enzyme related to lactoylglutathione lyase
VAEDPGTRAVIGLPEANLNMAILRLPGTNAFFEVLEYQNAPGRHPVDPDHANPSTCHIALYVDDIESTWATVEAAGSERVSTGIVEIPHGRLEGARVLYCTDPDGFRVEFLQSDAYLDGTQRAGTAGAAPA